MSTDVKKLPNDTAGNANSIGDAVTGAVVETVRAASNPADTVRDRVRSQQQAGAPVNRQLRNAASLTAEAAQATSNEIVQALMPERLALNGLRRVRDLAQRNDLVGTFAYRYLRFVHSSVGQLGRTLDRLEKASEAPQKRSSNRISRPTATARRASVKRTSAQRSVKRTATVTRKRATA